MFSFPSNLAPQKGGLMDFFYVAGILICLRLLKWWYDQKRKEIVLKRRRRPWE